MTYAYILVSWDHYTYVFFAANIVYFDLIERLTQLGEGMKGCDAEVLWYFMVGGNEDQREL